MDVAGKSVESVGEWVGGWERRMRGGKVKGERVEEGEMGERGGMKAMGMVILG